LQEGDVIIREMIDIDNARKKYEEYVKSYDLSDGKIALKYHHIMRVAEISKKIATELRLKDEDIKLAELIGIFHDIGRFEQIRQFNTFNDKDSINHAEYGVKVLFEDGMIEKFNVNPKYYETIKVAILNHNKRDIEDGLSEHDLLHCKIIRDSDKLDIFHVLVTEKIIDAYDIESLENETFSNEVIKEFWEEHSIDYSKMKTKGDLWIAHMAYIYDFNFKSSYNIMKEKEYVARLFEMAKFKNPYTKEVAEKIRDSAMNYVEEMI